MAIDPSAEYPGQIITGLPGYPLGKAVNVAVSGDGTGTPLEAKWVSDLFGWEQALLAAAGITPSGDPDEVGASDYLDALEALFGNRIIAPGATVDNEVFRADGTDGKTAQQSGLRISDAKYLEWIAQPSRTVWRTFTRATPEMTSAGVPAWWFDASVKLWKSRVNVAKIFRDIRGEVPAAAVITDIAVAVIPGAARATVGDRIKVDLYSDGSLHASATDDGTTSAQSISLSSSTSPAWVDLTQTAQGGVELEITSGSTGAASQDRLLAFGIQFDDPGPRND